MANLILKRLLTDAFVEAFWNFQKKKLFLEQASSSIKAVQCMPIDVYRTLSNINAEAAIGGVL